MLHKLLKYNLRAIYHTVIIFYLITLSCAIIGRLFRFGDAANPLIFFFRELFTGTAAGLCFGTIVNNITRIWEYTNRDFYGDQSYLTHTLPIPRHTLYFAKFFTATITILTTTVVIIITILISYSSPELYNFLHRVIDAYNSPMMIVFIICIAFLEALFITLSGISGIILGHRADNHKTAKSFTYGFTIFIVCNFITVGLVELWGAFYHPINDFINQGIYSENVVTQILISGIFIYLVYILANIVISNKSLQKGIDVE